ncbi:hypothetical protein SH139x_003543 [Planctomycetaceae bacterium SH139]
MPFTIVEISWLDLRRQQMSFWDHLFDSEYKQRTDIESLKKMTVQRNRTLRRTLANTEDHQARIETLEDQVGELALLCRSLLTILREDGTIQPERFEQVMQHIDEQDGTVDGKITPPDPPEPPPYPPVIRTR